MKITIEIPTSSQGFNKAENLQVQVERADLKDDKDDVLYDILKDEQVAPRTPVIWVIAEPHAGMVHSNWKDVYDTLNAAFGYAPTTKKINLRGYNIVMNYNRVRSSDFIILYLEYSKVSQGTAQVPVDMLNTGATLLPVLFCLPDEMGQACVSFPNMLRIEVSPMKSKRSNDKVMNTTYKFDAEEVGNWLAKRLV